MLEKFSTNPRLRSFLRNTGALEVLKRVVKKNTTYEERFSNELMNTIKEGNTVWDVGANVGFYTCKFAHKVSPNGKVVAFEPVSSSYNRMVNAFQNEGLQNVLPQHCALGHCDEQISIPVTAESPTNSLANKTSDTDSCELVNICNGDHLIATGLPAPNVIKIDVEAFEEEVIFGLRNFIMFGTEIRGGVNRSLSIFCEVHFEQLEKRSSRNAPSRIKSFLEDAGFKLHWIDASHFHAKRE
jgi:FkbM family methyltransferase